MLGAHIVTLAVQGSAWPGLGRNVRQILVDTVG